MPKDIKRTMPEKYEIFLENFNINYTINDYTMKDYFDVDGNLDSDFSKYHCDLLRYQAIEHYNKELKKLDADPKLIENILSRYVFDIDVSGLNEPLYYWRIDFISREKDVKLLTLDEFKQYCKEQKLAVISSPNGSAKELVSIKSKITVARVSLEVIIKHEIRFHFRPKPHIPNFLIFYKRPDLKAIGDVEDE